MTFWQWLKGDAARLEFRVAFLKAENASLQAKLDKRIDQLVTAADIIKTHRDRRGVESVPTKVQPLPIVNWVAARDRAEELSDVDGIRTEKTFNANKGA